MKLLERVLLFLFFEGPMALLVAVCFLALPIALFVSLLLFLFRG